MWLKIMTPDQECFSGEVQSVTLPGSAAPFEIRPGHSPITSKLDKGEVCFAWQAGRQTLQISQGWVMMQGDQVSVLVQGLTQESG